MYPSRLVFDSGGGSKICDPLRRRALASKVPPIDVRSLYAAIGLSLDAQRRDQDISLAGDEHVQDPGTSSRHAREDYAGWNSGVGLGVNIFSRCFGI